MTIAFYSALSVFGLSLVVVAVVLSVKIYEANAGKLLFSRKAFRKSDQKILYFFKRLDRLVKTIAVMSARRRAFKFFRLGKIKHLFSKLRKLVKRS